MRVVRPYILTSVFLKKKRAKLVFWSIFLLILFVFSLIGFDNNFLIYALLFLVILFVVRKRYLLNRKIYKKFVKVYSSKDAEFYYNRGIAYRYKGDYDRAIQDYNKAIEINPNDADAYYYRGLAYEKLGKKEEAERDFEIYEKLKVKK
ncbi:MAG: tetratricopeptide repeat protein [Ignavibacteria bacterium]|nr:tetratricopeptide repeat protein [Ignavibacteria bacterium]